MWPPLLISHFFTYKRVSVGKTCLICCWCDEDPPQETALIDTHLLPYTVPTFAEWYENNALKQLLIHGYIHTMWLNRGSQLIHWAISQTTYLRLQITLHACIFASTTQHTNHIHVDNSPFLLPLWLSHISCTYLVNSIIYGIKCIQHKTCF
jgi:hypothetical protein